MTCAPSAAASRAASSCLSIMASWVPAQSVCSSAALTVVDMIGLPLVGCLRAAMVATRGCARDP